MNMQGTVYTQMLHGAGIFTYMWVMLVVNVGKYSIHGASGIANGDLLMSWIMEP